MSPRERVIRVLLRILSNPYQYTRREIWTSLEASKEKIDGDIEAIKAAGLTFEQDRHHHCAIIPDNTFKELKYLQPLSENDRYRITTALNARWGERDVMYLNNKLNSLYDFQQLGLRSLRRPALEKIDRLEAANRKKEQAILVNYRSNSGEVKDRLVEPFNVDVEQDTVQAYDINNKKNRHFKLNRIERVLNTDKHWEYTNKHYRQETDVFRIADDNQISVCMKLDLFAYNLLVESFPKSRSEIDAGSEQNTFIFQSKVNADFLGLINFIMGNSEHIEVLSPNELKEKIKDRAKKILEKY